VSFLKRDHIISVRVSQDEYDRVERVSREHGAASVSDFVRRVVTNAKLSALIADATDHALLTHVAALQRQVDSLTRLVEQMRHHGAGSTDPALGSAIPASELAGGSPRDL